MSPKTHLVKNSSGRDGRLPGYKRKRLNPTYLRLKNFLVYWLPVFLYCLLIYIQSSYPAPEGVPPWPHIDKLLHLAAYAVLGVLFFRALKTLPRQHDLRRIMILSILLSSLYGISDEIHQHFVPYRNAEIVDALADILGCILGVYIYRYLWMKSRTNVRPK